MTSCTKWQNSEQLNVIKINLQKNVPFQNSYWYYSLLFLFSQDFNGSSSPGGDDKYLSVTKLPLSNDNINWRNSYACWNNNVLWKYFKFHCNHYHNVRDACKNHYVVIHANKIYMNYVVEGRIALQQIKFCCCVMINLKQFTCPGEINTSLSF